VTSLLRVSAAQAEATSKETGIKTGEIWGTGELRGWFEDGARRIARDEEEREVGGVVHGDYKIDNLVSADSIWVGEGRDRVGGVLACNARRDSGVMAGHGCEMGYKMWKEGERTTGIGKLSQMA
jgi:hypothetical protein